MVAFSTDKTIFQQLADRIADEILAEKHKADERIPSVREYAVMMEVNPNTAVKAFEVLARDGIIYNKRGMGYFVATDAHQKVLAARQKVFWERTLPEFVRQMNLVGATVEDVAAALLSPRN